MTDRERYRRTDRTQDVGFVFGALAATHLPGPVLVRLLGQLHLTESAARNTLAKMVRQRVLVSEPVGRRCVYSLPPAVLEKYRQVQGVAEPQPWSGRYFTVIHGVPESARWYRDRLQYTAAYFGFGALRPGVLIGTRDRAAALLEHLGGVPEGAVVHHAQLVPAFLAEARRMAADAWDLDALATRYAHVIERIETAERTHPRLPDGHEARWDVFRAWNRLYREVTDLQIADPHVPGALLPRSWPRADHGARLRALNMRWGPGLTAFLREDATSHDPAGLCRYEDWYTHLGEEDAS